MLVTLCTFSVLIRDEELLLLSHATRNRIFSAFSADDDGARQFVAWIEEIVNELKRVKSSTTITSVGILGCEVPITFAETVQSIFLIRSHNVTIKILPPVRGSGLKVLFNDSRNSFQFQYGVLGENQTFAPLLYEGDLVELPKLLKTPKEFRGMLMVG